MSRSIYRHSFIIFLLMILYHPLQGQDTIDVRGRIVANKNEPLKDVSVSVERMDQAPVLTNQNGEFTIRVPGPDVWLIINPVGNYKTRRIYLNNRNDVVISLSEEGMKSGYDEIPVINQSRNRRDMVTSFTDIDPDQLQLRNGVSVDQAFQGIVPGMFTINHSGMPGQGALCYIRGITSMNNTNSPYYIVNGMPLETPGLFESGIDGNIYNPLTSIDPSDISGITILKGPPAVSLYGLKASNGVILINTLEPKSTQTTIKVSIQGGLNMSPENYIPQLNDEQYKTLANEILVSSNKKEEEFGLDYPGLFITSGDDEYYRYMHNTNWQELVFSNALMSNAYLSVKGGSDIARYGLSVGYHDQGGIFKNSNYNRINVRFIADLNIFSWFNMEVNANLSNNNSSLKESAVSPQTNPVTTSLSKPPILSPYQYDEKGQRLTLIDEVDELGTSNPLAVIENFIGENKNYRFLSSIKGHADISETLKFNLLLGLNLNTMKESVFMPNKGMEMYYNGEAHSITQYTFNQLFSFFADSYLDYSKQFGATHQFNSMLGFRIHSSSLQVDIGETMNLPENDEYKTLSSGQSDLRRAIGNNARWNWLAVYHRINYKLRDTYILNTGLSADFSTRLGDDARTPIQLFDQPFGLFYSIGAGWRISNENFLKNVNGLENLMARISYGVAGNDNIGNFNALSYYKLTRYRETSGLVPGSIPNNFLKYEKSGQINAGLDLSLWGYRTQLILDYFIKTNEDIFIYEPQESYTGYKNKPANAGTVRNKGWELSFFHRLFDGTRFKWDISSVISLLSNEVLDMKGGQIVTPFEGGSFITRKGDPINSFYGYQFEGVFASYEEAAAADLKNAKGVPYGAGDAIYKDFSGPDQDPDGIINEYDKVFLGSPVPDYFGSVSNTFRYNRWNLLIQIQFVQGNEVFNYIRYLNESMSDLSNQSKNVLKRWQNDGDQTEVPRALWKDPVGNSVFSSRWIEDGSYLRLKNVRFGYTIPENFLFFKNADFYVSAINLLTLDMYLGYDPEFSYSFNPMRQGIDYGLMPQYRQFQFGIKFGL